MATKSRSRRIHPAMTKPPTTIYEPVRPGNRPGYVPISPTMAPAPTTIYEPVRPGGTIWPTTPTGTKPGGKRLGGQSGKPKPLKVKKPGTSNATGKAGVAGKPTQATPPITVTPGATKQAGHGSEYTGGSNKPLYGVRPGSTSRYITEDNRVIRKRAKPRKKVGPSD